MVAAEPEMRVVRFLVGLVGILIGYVFSVPLHLSG